MQYFLDQLINGLSLGSVYALIALGFSLAYGVLKVLNFAHSEVFTATVFVAYYIQRALSNVMPDSDHAILSISLLGASLAGGLLALVIERVAYRPLTGRPKVAALLTAIGVSILLQSLGIHLLGAQTRGFPQLDLGVSPRLFALVALLGTFGSLILIVYKSDLGLRMRAVADGPAVARLLGVKPQRVIAMTFFLGGAFAGIAGVVWGLLYGTVHPQMGFYPGLKAFIIAVIGSVGSLSGTFLTGILLGVCETMVGAYLPSSLSGYRDIIAFGLLLAVLIWKPSGIFGSTAQEKV